MATLYKIPTVKVLDLPFSALSRDGMLRLAHRMAKKHAPFSVFTPNAEITLYASKHPEFARILRSADLLLPDGVGVTAAARLAGDRLIRTAGIDFAEEMLATAPAEGYRLFLLGGRPGVAVRAGRALTARYPSIRIVGAQDGYYAPGMERAVAAAVRAAAPDLLFVCLGSPRQEEWIARYRIPCLAIGLGGALDVFAGDAKRAPERMRRAGLEWLFRAANDPGRIPRLLALPAFAGRVLLSLSKSKKVTAD